MSSAVAFAADEFTFDYSLMQVKDLRVITEEDPKTGKKKVKKVVIRDEEMEPTERFFTSLYSRFGFNKAFFKYFDHLEVFNRISEVEKDDRMRLTVQRNSKGEGTMLAVSSPKKPIVVYEELMNILGRYKGIGLTYHNGIVESTHVPRAGANRFTVEDDEFVNRFLLATPIDGYGAPNIYLALMREPGDSLVVGYSKTFKAALALGKADDDVTLTMARALDGFGNDEGFAAIRQRIEAASKSWASVHEANEQFYKLMIRLHAKVYIDDTATVPPGAVKVQKLLENDAAGSDVTTGIGSPLIKAYHAMTGDTQKLYGFANLDSLSQKRQKTLPVKCTVYDLVSLATEIATHYAKPAGSRLLQEWVGNMFQTEYDMENTRDQFGNFSDFYVNAREDAGLATTAKGTAVSHQVLKEYNDVPQAETVENEEVVAA